MEIEGKIEAISFKNKGVKVNGRWYNVPDELMHKLSKNDRVRLDIDDFGNVLRVDVLEHNEYVDKDIRLASLNAAIEILKISFQYGQFPVEFVNAKQSKTVEEEVNKFVDLLLKTQKRIENWLK